VSQQLSSESASSAHLFATRLRKEKMRLLATFLRAARELKSLGNCPTLFKTVQDEKNRESRLENTVRFIAALRDNIQRLEKAIVVEHEARTREEHAAKHQLQALKDQLREMKTELQVAQRFEEAGSKANINTIRRAHAQEEARLARHIAELNEQADREDKAFKLSDEFLLRKQGRAEEQLAAWNGKAEREIKELTERLERLTQDREKTITDLRAAEDSFKRETAEKEARLDRERRRVEAEEHFRKCVIIVQKMIRGFLARKRVAKLIKERKAEKKKAAAAAKGDKKKK
jgi:chromosome segregation ATPase